MSKKGKTFAKPVHRPVSLNEWAADEHAHRFVTRGELMSILDLHYKALRRLTWWFKLWLGVRWLVGMHPRQIETRRLKRVIAERRIEHEAAQKEKGAR